MVFQCFRWTFGFLFWTGFQDGRNKPRRIEKEEVKGGRRKKNCVWIFLGYEGKGYWTERKQERLLGDASNGFLMKCLRPCGESCLDLVLV
jgi:hypothetical protein